MANARAIIIIENKTNDSLRVQIPPPASPSRDCMSETRASSVIIEEDSKILMLDRKFPPLGLDLIGGYIDEDETPEEAAVREAKEEANIEISIESKVCSFKWRDRRGYHLEHIFRATISKGRPSDSREGRAKFIPINEVQKMQLAFPTMVRKSLKYYEKSRSEILMENKLLQKLLDKSITKEELLQKVKQDFELLPTVLKGVSSSKAAIRYGCAKVLMDLSEEYPEKLYPYMDSFIDLLDSKYRILTWNAMAIIASLTKVDKDGKFDGIFDKYYGFLNDEYMVTVANVVGHSGKIALAKPNLIPKITNELLKVEEISTTTHLTEECKRVIAEKTIESFNMFFGQIKPNEKVIAFVKRHLDSPRATLRTEAENFLKKWS